MELTRKTLICMTFYNSRTFIHMVSLDSQNTTIKCIFPSCIKENRGRKGSRSLLVNELVAVLRPAESPVLALSHRTASTYPPNPLRA